MMSRSLTGRQRRQLAHQLRVLDSAEHSVSEVAALLARIAPTYVMGEREVISTQNGQRWFREPIEAVADAIWLAAEKADLRPRPWHEVVSLPHKGPSSLWAAPLRNTARQPLRPEPEEMAALPAPVHRG